MASIPGIRELRSISRFGLSLVTIVFDDDVYWARDQVDRRLSEVQRRYAAQDDAAAPILIVRDCASRFVYRSRPPRAKARGQ